jgi:hypothetical protein
MDREKHENKRPTPDRVDPAPSAFLRSQQPAQLAELLMRGKVKAGVWVRSISRRSNGTLGNFAPTQEHRCASRAHSNSNQESHRRLPRHGPSSGERGGDQNVHKSAGEYPSPGVARPPTLDRGNDFARSINEKRRRQKPPQSGDDKLWLREKQNAGEY